MWWLPMQNTEWFRLSPEEDQNELKLLGIRSTSWLHKLSASSTGCHIRATQHGLYSIIVLNKKNEFFLYFYLILYSFLIGVNSLSNHCRLEYRKFFILLVDGLIDNFLNYKIKLSLLSRPGSYLLTSLFMLNGTWFLSWWTSNNLMTFSSLKS